LQRGDDGAWAYSLRWLHLPGHTGDQLNLRVDLPPGWVWQDAPPPATTDLDREFVGTWSLSGPR
jgi:hypothetical protein